MSHDTLPNADHLTNALRNAGARGDALVQQVEIDSDRPTLLSRIVRLRLSYHRPADGAPRTLNL